jgi:hypothetical protein
MYIYIQSHFDIIHTDRCTNPYNKSENDKCLTKNNIIINFVCKIKVVEMGMVYSGRVTLISSTQIGARTPAEITIYRTWFVYIVIAENYIWWWIWLWYNLLRDWEIERRSKLDKNKNSIQSGRYEPWKWFKE